jgi:protein SCO1/2
MSLPVSAPASSAPQPAVSATADRKSLFGSPFFWLALVALGLSVPLLTRVLAPPAPPLPVLGTLPAFSLTDQEGRPFGSTELRGRVWLAGFIFTRCPTICPAITGTMGRIQHRARSLEPAFRLVSFSVDPGYDTPPRLTEYAARHKASPRMWSFLTGGNEAVKQTVVEGLKIAMGDAPGPEEAASGFANVLHGTHFVLVDQEGRIRGYYDSSKPDVVDLVLHDAAMLINRGR